MDKKDLFKGFDEKQYGRSYYNNRTSKGFEFIKLLIFKLKSIDYKLG